MGIFEAIVLGIVEGVTEFLPVSSTGHMILAAKLMGLTQDDSFLKTFEICIQLGSILAVVFLFLKRLTQSWGIWVKIIIGFIPTGVLGLVLYPYIKTLFDPSVVAYMLIIGGFVFIAIEWRNRNKTYPVTRLEEIDYKRAFWIGLSQSLAMIPGTSRSGATIVGGLLLGLDRKCAAEFSFLLAIPTMVSATCYTLYKNHQILSSDHLSILLLGFAVAFFVALMVMKVFLRFVSSAGYVWFGIYRIAIGLVFLLWIL
ncbi:undecaprenyl-diphosphatase [Helicobacter enhydrae]|uniref:Undecaprenyl-diphosphatase n=1 Tax=Helicobacter enhydrae TaxID=222136 RepID=A0A1B1U3J1_9HELI|nr:undecaprenyl-diphosphate phosphatase [Helicobacter enhydrae]ANV97344.1 undecaprenyl-diphosphatase [Helicobacter enhydrae]